MLVQRLHLIPERFLTFSQHAPEWIFGVEVKWRKHYVALLGTCIKSQGRPVCSCSHCVPGAGGGIGCALSGKKRNQQRSKRKQIDIQESFFLLFTTISSSRIGNKSSTSQTSLLKKMIYLADHRPEKNSDEYKDSMLWLYLFCDRIISSVKLVHICWITNLHISAPNLLHSPAYFLLKQPRLDKKWYPSMSVRNAD